MPERYEDVMKRRIPLILLAVALLLGGIGTTGAKAAIKEFEVDYHE